MDFQAIVQRSLEVRVKYSELEKRKYGREWTREEIAQGLVGDIGDLLKLVTAKSGVRDVPDSDSKLAHELSDCLWSVIVLANKYDINLEEAFTKTMDELEEKIAVNG